MRMIRTGVIGCGAWGPNLVRNFHKLKNCAVVAAADQDATRLVAVKNIYPHLDATTEAEEIFRRRDVDAVAVATPVSTHFALAKRALECGKHVLLEKPVTETAAQAEELIDLAGRMGLVLMVDHTFVYADAVRKIRDLITGGELGTTFYLDSVRVNLGLFQRDVNALWDLAPHDFSIMTYLLDEEPRSVSAIGASPIRYGDRSPESIVYVTVRLAGGTLAHFHLSWLSPVKIRRMLIGGSRRMVVYDHLDLDNQVKIYDKGMDASPSEEPGRFPVQRRTGDMYAPKIDQTEPLEQVCRHFVDCVRDGCAPVTDGLAGLKIMRLLEASQLSMERGGEVITL